MDSADGSLLHNQRRAYQRAQMLFEEWIGNFDFASGRRSAGATCREDASGDALPNGYARHAENRFLRSAYGVQGEIPIGVVYKQDSRIISLHDLTDAVEQLLQEVWLRQVYQRGAREAFQRLHLLRTQHSRQRLTLVGDIRLL